MDKKEEVVCSKSATGSIMIPVILQGLQVNEKEN